MSLQVTCFSIAPKNTDHNCSTEKTAMQQNMCHVPCHLLRTASQTEQHIVCFQAGRPLDAVHSCTHSHHLHQTFTHTTMIQNNNDVTKVTQVLRTTHSSADGSPGVGYLLSTALAKLSPPPKLAELAPEGGMPRPSSG